MRHLSNDSAMGRDIIEGNSASIFSIEHELHEEEVMVSETLAA